MDHRQLIARYDGRVPRYTSYPTALHFRSVTGSGWYEDWLGGLPANAGLSLYLHIPFCRVMCWYCGCHTRVAKDDVPVQAYAAALRREIGLVSKALGRRARAHRIHWGGGTPTLLSPEIFAVINRDLREHFDIDADAEHAVEADPRTLDDARCGALAAAGVNRVSLGVQTLSDDVQRKINRVQPFAQVATAVQRLRAAGVSALNVDLMYGLPTQTTEDVIATTEEVIRLGPSRVALFGYAHVPWMKSHQQRILTSELPDAVERFDQLLAGTAVLTGAGYRRIGLDHFALENDPLARAAVGGGLHRNFQGYTDDRSPHLLGLGASAISEMPEGYAQNAVAIPDWQQAVFSGRLPVAKMRALSPEDVLRREAIETLMCGRPLDLSRLVADHSLPPDHLDESLDRLAGATADGLVAIDGRCVEVTERGWPFMRSIASAFDAYLSPSETRHARAV